MEFKQRKFKHREEKIKKGQKNYFISGLLCLKMIDDMDKFG